MRIFISHGSHDTWIARQMERCIRECGAETFLDVYDLKTGDEWKRALFREIGRADEMVVLVTPFSEDRAWLWTEIGAAMMDDKPVRPILFGLSMRDLHRRRNAGPLSDMQVRDLNQFDTYLVELKGRIAGDR